MPNIDIIKATAAFEAYKRDPAVQAAIALTDGHLSNALLFSCFIAGASYATARCEAEHHGSAPPVDELRIAGMSESEMLSIVREFEVPGDAASGVHIPAGGDLAHVINAMSDCGYPTVWGARGKESLRLVIPQAFQNLKVANQ